MATARQCWTLINAMIVPGSLPGNGADKAAQRNGLILAANVLFPLAFPRPFSNPQQVGRRSKMAVPLRELTEQEMDRQIIQAVQEVEKLCEPERMTKEQAKEYLEGVVSALEASIEALEDEIANEEDPG